GVDLLKAYNKVLDSQLVNGTGSNGQLLGATQVAGINTTSGSGATSVTVLWPLLGQVAAAVGNGRGQPMTLWLMAPRRWAWIASSLENSNRPIASPGNTGPHLSDLPVAGGSSPVGPVLAKPVYEAGALNTGASADLILAVRPEEMYLWEGEPRMVIARNPLSGTAQIRVQLHRYAAAVLGGFPSGIGQLSAIPAPANF